MLKAYVIPAISGAFLLGLATTALAGEFGNQCTMALALKFISKPCPAPTRQIID